jgi:hypothetical protein
MCDDQIIGDGGNVTVYERPDQTRYALDKRGNGVEWPTADPVFGRARFDSRSHASGVWEGSRSAEQVPELPASGLVQRRARRM